MLDIRRATTEDIPIIRTMASVVFPDTYKNILKSEQIDYMMEWMYSEESLYKQMKSEKHLYYLVYQDSKPAGYLSLQLEDEQTAHLHKLYVLPTFQGMHIGKSLFEYAIAAIKNLRPTLHQMRLNVNRYNNALSFYQRMGMMIIDEGDFPIGNGYYMNDYIMGIEI